MKIIIKNTVSSRVKAYGFLAVVLLALAGYFLKDRYLSPNPGDPTAGNPGGPKAETTTPVELAIATKGPISSYLSSTANLRALRVVDVTAQAEGVVKRVSVEEGDYVNRGQLLCLLDDAKARIALELAEEKLEQAKIQLEKAEIQRQKAVVQTKNKKLELERYQTALDERLVSEEEVAGLRYQLAELEHDQRVAKSQAKEITHRVEELNGEISQSKLDLAHTRIKAPFSGNITHRTVELGQTVRNLDSLFRLASFSPLYADVHLSEREARQVRPEQAAMVSLGVSEEGIAEGSVLRISPVVDDATGTVKVTVELKASGPGFKPGAFARIKIQTATREDAVLIPKQAVVEQDGQTSVFVANGDTAQRRTVTLGYENDYQVEVREGVSVGQRVVVAGQGNLKEGAKIREVET